MYGLIIQISALVFLLLLTTIYFGKRRINTQETKIYSALIFINIIGVILDISSTSLALFNKQNILLNPISKLYLVYLIAISLMFVYYTVYISYSEKIKNNNRLTLFFTVLILILSIITLMMPLYNFSENNLVYTYGLSVTFTKLIGVISYIVMIFCIVKNYKNVVKKKYIPLLGFVILGILGAVIQLINPEILIITFTIIYVTFSMYLLSKILMLK